MRVHALVRPDEQRPYAFEVRSTWSVLRPIVRILEAVPGVTEVRRGGGALSSDENRVYFLFHGVPFVVWEPFGDNDRYWIGPADPNLPAPDLGPLMHAFRNTDRAASQSAEM